jgi:hypothetical protein
MDAMIDMRLNEREWALIGKMAVAGALIVVGLKLVGVL